MDAGNGGPDKSDQNARVYVCQQEEAGQRNAWCFGWDTFLCLQCLPSVARTPRYQSPSPLCSQWQKTTTRRGSSSTPGSQIKGLQAGRGWAKKGYPQRFSSWDMKKEWLLSLSFLTKSIIFFTKSVLFLNEAGSLTETGLVWKRDVKAKWQQHTCGRYLWWSHKLSQNSKIRIACWSKS